MALRVLVVGDETSERARVARLVERTPGMRLAGEATTREALPTARASVILWIADEAELDVARAGAPVVALVDDAARAGELLGRGVSALLSPQKLERLEAAAEAALSGLVAIEPDLLGALTAAPPAEEATLALTGREQDVLELLGEALSNKEIGVRLGISEHTVKFHVNTVYRKLGVREVWLWKKGRSSSTRSTAIATERSTRAR